MHDIGDDHTHGEGDSAALEKDHPLWRTDRMELRSVGIDIGSSTSHLIFSTLELRRQSAILSSRFELAARRIDHASPIVLTPFVAGTALDVTRLAAFLEATYAAAGIGKTDIDTGAVITTGDAARKDNAESVVQLFSEMAGKFVCASAGPLLEAKMAAYGSGAVARSARDDQAATVLNVDIGGGTSKLAIVRAGRVVEATAINVGARLVTFDDQDTLTKIEPAAAAVARHRGFDLAVGMSIREKVKLDLAAGLVDALLELAARAPLSPLTRDLLIAAPLRFPGDIDLVMFSGGVSEYFYRRDTRGYGDIGPQIARLLRQRLPKALPAIAIEAPTHGIRATVIGASQFTVQVSGNTLFVPRLDLLPQRNLQVVVVDCAAIPASPEEIAAEIGRKLAEAEVPDGRAVALAIRWPHGPAYLCLDSLASGVAAATNSLRQQSLPVILMLDVDVARLTGAILSERTRGYDRLLCIDGIDLHEFDYVDIGELHPETGVVTVIVKSLVFSG